LNCEHDLIGCLFVELSLQGQGSVSVADVPVRRLDLFDATCSHCRAILMLCLLLLKDRIHDATHQRGGVTRGDELSVVMALCFVHVLIINRDALMRRKEQSLILLLCSYERTTQSSFERRNRLALHAHLRLH